MAQKTKVKPKKITVAQTLKGKIRREKKQNLLVWWLIPAAITFVCFFPMLQNGFTNWDDQDYVTKNMMLRSFDLKAIFSATVNGNYHPLTMLSLALNYQMTELNASSYLITNLLIHLANTALVFYFIWLISGKRKEVAFFTALVFGIHPMHVESVAWVSERKDVLYTFFFLLSLIQYWQFLETNNRKKLWLCFFWFALSLLSKPAAIILPFVLLLLDYWKGRALSWKLVVEKIPFFIAAFAFAIITYQIQSHTTTIADLQSYPAWIRPLFGCYTLMIYSIRFFIPYPLSTFHPYPEMGHLGYAVMLSPIFFIALISFLWFKRKNKLIVFGILFFVVNLLLILQIISIGSSIVSERYTYVPYIGIAFLLAMLLTRKKDRSVSTKWIWIISSIITMVFGFMTFDRTKVWKNGGTLWSDVLDHYPTANLPRTNRANYYVDEAEVAKDQNEITQLYNQAIEDCNTALRNKPDYIPAFEIRQNVYMNMNRNDEAFVDANNLLKFAPNNKIAYSVRGVIYARRNDPEKSLEDLNKAISLGQESDFVYSYRGFVYFNFYKNYKAALDDFTRAININPLGAYFLNRSYCYHYLGDDMHAKEDAATALQKGIIIPDRYRQLIKL